MEILLGLWMMFGLILLGYYLRIFRFPGEKAGSIAGEELPGVSVVIAVKNGHPLFSSFLKRILDQDYPLFEVLVVDDHSDPGELDQVVEMATQHPQIKMIHASGTHGKKSALILGVQKASFPIILCTDADCYPLTSHWITRMVQHGGMHSMAIGYSPYEKRKGLINLWIRFETLITGMQYLSWAGIGNPYMGVGRNLLFPKEWFLKTQPLSEAMQVPYGDDDELVQKASAQMKVIPVVSPDSIMVSQPATSWKVWWRQKHRHMSAGHQYNASSWLKPGIMGMALIGHWLLLPMVAYQWHPWTMVIFLVALLVRWLRYSWWARKLGDRDAAFYYPVLEAIYALYLAGMGIYTLFNPKKKWN